MVESRWGALCAVALALASSPAILDVLAQPVLVAVPALGDALPGGTIDVNVQLAQELGTEPAQSCVYLMLETGAEEEWSALSSQHVCPRYSTHALLVAPRARGVLVVEWNGSIARVPFLVPEGGEASTSVAVDVSGLQVGAGPTLVDHTRSNGSLLWAGAAHALAFVAFLGLLALRGRMAWLLGSLAAVTLLLIPLSAKQLPHVPGWIVFVAWAVFGAEAFWRTPGGRTRAHEAGPHGEPLDEPAVP